MLSVYVCLCCKERNLKWPFEGTIKVSLLNQLEDGQHHTKQVWSLDDDIREDGRVTGRERAACGWGQAKLICHQDLCYCGATNCQYLKDNTLFFRVDRFEQTL